MKHLIIDSEQEAMLTASLGGIAEFLRARSVRRDPLGVISRAAALQQRKVENMTFQLQQPPLARFEQVEPERVANFEKLLRTYLSAETAHMKSMLWTHILAFMLAQRAQSEPPKLPIEKLEGEI